MGTNYGPRVVTNGLVMYFDNGNKKSWRGTDTDWNDLISGTNYNYSVPNPSWANNISTITICAVVEKIASNTEYATHVVQKWNNGTSNASFVLYHFGTNVGADPTADGRIGFYGTSSDNGWHSIGNSNLGNLSINQKAYFCMQWDSIRGGQVWMNGKKVGSRDGSGILGVAGNSDLAIYGPTTWDNYTIVHNVAFYTREITDAEILQNYNALKGRYGL